MPMNQSPPSLHWSSNRRAYQGTLPFHSLSHPQRKDLCDRAAEVAVKRPELLYLAADEVVAAQFNVRIDDCDRNPIKNAVSRRAAAAKQPAIPKAHAPPSLLPQGQENVLPYSSTVTVPEAPGHVQGVNRSKSGRNKMDTISAAADATTKGFKGASSHQVYQNLIKEACKVATGNKLQNGV
eukprot:jgi/Tetstr1/429121/TSEL_019083.t1